MICSIANHVNDNTLQSITDLEKDLGKTLLAFSCHDLNASALRARAKISSQIVSVQAPAQQGAKTKEYLAYAVFS